ncbi:hypothetical protein EW026_g3182 [Hermanssonia centrifuga]|uniref:FMN hydroxy acid dehydrogenase domain-containing protein n=1 Tax=Hermanssonia centrifuga TaxID=98765 RepID=A0A4S4KLH7_9APHY|nr:hypothetical protein EW026_g3182 [Hermanssonia centrifuga]
MSQAGKLAHDADHKPWSNYMLEVYVSKKPPTLGTYSVDRIEQLAREKLKDRPDAFMYVFGSAGTYAAYAANRQELDKWKIIPRMLRDATVRDLDTTLFGVKYKSPIIVAPVGVQGIVHADGEIATATAANNVGVTYVMSTASTRTIESVGKANGSGHRWYQLYWPVDKDATLSLLQRAKASGFTALIVTLDTMLLGWRPHDLEKNYLPFLHGVGAQVGLSDPVFMGKYNEEPIMDVPDFPYDPEKYATLHAQGDEKTNRTMKMAAEWLKQTNSGTFKSWEDLKFLRANWEGPLILKGILAVQDAEMAMDYGVDGIVVSNHGGRQVDGAVPSIWALHKICSSPKIKAAQASGKLTVLFDSGIRTGSDIIKAIALGAQAVLLARPFMYGLAVGGQDGVEEVLRSTLADLEITLGLSGYKNIKEIQGRMDEVVVKIS